MKMTKETMEKYLSESKEIAELVIEKQAAYGDSFSKSEDIIKILYPEGISPEQYSDALTVIRMIDKLFRIATKKNAFGESPYKDIMGYALLSVVRDDLNKTYSIKDNLY